MTMDARAKKKNKYIIDEKGQAFFEMIMFVPFMLFLFTLIVTFGNSVNGAINQNKLLRGFFYTTTRNNSYGHTLKTLTDLQGFGMDSSGLHNLAFAEDSEGNNRFASCYRINRFFGGRNEEECKDRTSGAEESAYIRVFTYYGLCGANWRYNGQVFENQDFQANTISACRNQ
jgi:hypothetical protein